MINVCETKSKLTKPIYTKTNELKQNDLNSAIDLYKLVIKKYPNKFEA